MRSVAVAAVAAVAGYLAVAWLLAPHAPWTKAAVGVVLAAVAIVAACSAARDDEP